MAELFPNQGSKSLVHHPIGRHLQKQESKDERIENFKMAPTPHESSGLGPCARTVATCPCWPCWTPARSLEGRAHSHFPSSIRPGFRRQRVLEQVGLRSLEPPADRPSQDSVRLPKPTLLNKNSDLLHGAKNWRSVIRAQS